LIGIIAKRLLLVAAAFGAIGFAAAGQSNDQAALELPPASLAEWYKPNNKRQVWLHTMFSLRRELQAVEEYLELGEQERLGKWSERLVEHYLSIGEMVPEWQKMLEKDAAKQLLEVAEQEPESVRKNLDAIKESCRSCHKQYRALTALLYRTPDFEPIRIGKGLDNSGRSYAAEMKTLSRQVNRIKIAFEDGRDQAALDALGALKRSLENLRSGCSECHQDDYPVERILGGCPRMT